MTPQDQQHINPKTGDCFATCVASILDLPRSDVPNFMEYGGDLWWTEFLHWLHERKLRAVARSSEDTQLETAWRGYWIATGKSPRGEYHHAVVYFGSDMVHDPHPSRDGLDGPPVYGIKFIPLEEHLEQTGGACAD